MTKEVIFEQTFAIQGGDFKNGGDASCRISTILKEVGIDPDIILRAAVTAYEAEMNVVMHAPSGTMSFRVTPRRIFITVEDDGNGIDDIQKAMQPGYSTATAEMREMGFGAGMGLPNIKKNADKFQITSQRGKGTKLEIFINLNGQNG